ncbi:MAG: DinB family protein [bacterium]
MIELIHTFKNTLKFMKQSVADLSEQEMVEQPTGVRNHATWTLGHVIYSCQGIANEMGVQGWLPNDWESIFGYGSTPMSDLSRYPSKSDMLKILTDAEDRLVQILLNVSESTLKQSLPDETLPTMSHLLSQVIIAHTAFHAGQLAMWRGAIGKKSVAVFV